MNEIVMTRADPHVLLHHLALYGLASILEEGGVRDVRLCWTSGMEPRPQVRGRDLNDDVVGELVARHATSRADERSWVQRDVELGGKARGLLSPRLSTLGQPEWRHVQELREHELGLLTHDRAWADLRFLAALGEPCYWSSNRKDNVPQDDGASRLEMQPRNQGSEFVKTRLRQLAAAVGARDPASIAAGIRQRALASDKAVVRTTVGLSNLLPTDNALVWCALWGIAELPTAPGVGRAAVTTGHLGRPHAEWFYAPVWERPWRPARLRSILAAGPLRDAAATGLNRLAVDTAAELRARAWLSARGIVGFVRFPIGRFGSKLAPERRALGGVPFPTASS